jgi:hypothetical protein
MILRFATSLRRLGFWDVPEWSRFRTQYGVDAKGSSAHYLIARNLQSLRELPSSMSREMLSLVPHCPRLRRLSAGWAADLAAKIVAACPELERLEFEDVVRPKPLVALVSGAFCSACRVTHADLPGRFLLPCLQCGRCSS